MGVSTPETEALEASLEAVEAEAAKLAAEAARLRERYAARGGDPDTAREALEDIEQLRARFMRQLDEYLPAPPIGGERERLGSRPASAEQYRDFLAEHEIPTKGA